MKILTNYTVDLKVSHLDCSNVFNRRITEKYKTPKWVIFHTHITINKGPKFGPNTKLSPRISNIPVEDDEDDLCSSRGATGPCHPLFAWFYGN